jgi:secondary thiamine-phosphate synthase enzyme
MTKLEVRTRAKEEVLDVTSKVRDAVKASGVRTGVCVVYVPHTTAAVWINENADPDVPRDILFALRRFIPEDGYRHAEGNSPAHVRSAVIGASVVIPIEDGKLALGRWQGVQLGEFDGPRSREVWVQIVGP